MSRMYENCGVLAIPSKESRKMMKFKNLKECAAHFMLREQYVEYLIESGSKYKQYYFDWID